MSKAKKEEWGPKVVARAFSKIYHLIKPFNYNTEKNIKPVAKKICNILYEAIDALPVPPLDLDNEELYYLQDSRSYCGNCMMFWRKNDAGYTYNLDDCAVF